MYFVERGETMDRLDLSAFVQDHRRALEREAAAERMTRRGAARHVAAVWLRSLADRLDPVAASRATLTPRPLHAKGRL